MITTIERIDLESKFLFTHRRKELYAKFLVQFFILQEQCRWYQLLLTGSFIKAASKTTFGHVEKPGDVDVILRAFVSEHKAKSMNRHPKNSSVIIPFTDFDCFVDICPPTAEVDDNPEAVEPSLILDRFNECNKFTVEEAFLIPEFQRMPSISVDEEAQDGEFLH